MPLASGVLLVLGAVTALFISASGIAWVGPLLLLAGGVELCEALSRGDRVGQWTAMITIAAVPLILASGSNSFIGVSDAVALSLFGRGLFLLASRGKPGSPPDLARKAAGAIDLLLVLMLLLEEPIDALGLLLFGTTPEAAEGLGLVITISLLGRAFVILAPPQRSRCRRAGARPIYVEHGARR
ncbi:MAG TPA: hypothetical protein VF662_08755 [Allosphingosinicella sp.]